MVVELLGKLHHSHFYENLGLVAEESLGRVTLEKEERYVSVGGVNQNRGTI